MYKFVTFFLFLINSVFAQDGSFDAGMQKNASCQGCHGIDGFRTAYPEVYSVPMIGGQSETYLINALKAYRSGDRTHPGMRAIATTLSDQDIFDLGILFIQQKKLILKVKL